MKVTRRSTGEDDAHLLEGATGPDRGKCQERGDHDCG
jgi:hypothetical protein